MEVIGYTYTTIYGNLIGSILKITSCCSLCTVTHMTLVLLFPIIFRRKEIFWICNDDMALKSSWHDHMQQCISILVHGTCRWRIAVIGARVDYVPSQAVLEHIASWTRRSIAEEKGTQCNKSSCGAWSKKSAQCYVLHSQQPLRRRLNYSPPFL